jgi:hypothetical protein
MATTERFAVSTYFVTYYYRHPLVSQPSKMNMYIALQNEDGVSCLTVTVNKIQLTMPMVGETMNGTPCKLVF